MNSILCLLRVKKDQWNINSSVDFLVQLKYIAEPAFLAGKKKILQMIWSPGCDEQQQCNLTWFHNWLVYHDIALSLCIMHGNLQLINGQLQDILPAQMMRITRKQTLTRGSTISTKNFGNAISSAWKQVSWPFQI